VQRLYDFEIGPRGDRICGGNVYIRNGKVAVGKLELNRLAKMS
jgi:hypothetical protein